MLVLAKEPVPGRVKTRLCPPYTLQAAAELAAAALEDTLNAVRATPAARRVVVLSGEGAWPGFEVLPQRGGGLDERLAAAFDDAGHPLPTLLIGMDTPQVTAALLSAAATALLSADAVLGLATDGGFWALGLRRPDARLIRGVPMSSDRTGAEQLIRLRQAGLRVALLPALTDVDDAQSAAVVAAAAPNTRFAQLLRTAAAA